jgi:hypothetical protein
MYLLWSSDAVVAHMNRHLWSLKNRPHKWRYSYSHLWLSFFDKLLFLVLIWFY